MKFYLGQVLLFFSGFPAFCQVGFGPEAGIGMCSMKFVPPSLFTNSSTGTQISGKAGGIMDVPMNKHVYFQAGLYFELKGGVRDYSYYHDTNYNATVHQQLNLYYADLPLNVLYKSGMQGKGRFVTGLGVSLSYVLGGINKVNEHSVTNDTLINTNGTFGVKAGNTLLGLDVGMNVLAGYELATGLFFRAYYTVGVKDIGPLTEVDKNRMWGLSAGYIFGKGRNIKKEADDLIDKGTD